jgi:mannitol/fructose-specific phosphotransferase system IIA component (Ntr-type)
VLLKTLLAGATLAGALWVAARRLGRLVDADRNATAIAVYGLGGALLAGGLCWFFGLSPLLGAYALGVALATSELRHPLQERLEFLHAAFVPACFAFVGAQVDPRLLIAPGPLLFALLFSGATLAAQTLGVGAWGWCAGLNARGCWRAAASLLPRGEMTLAVVLSALALGAPAPELLAAITLLTLVAGAAAPALTAQAFRHGGVGARRGFAARKSLRLSFRFPAHQAARLVLSRLIDLFEDEGFYIGLLNRREALYQFTRDESLITAQRQGGEIVFVCEETDRDLVHAAMLEVVAGIEQGMRELREPLDAMSLRRQLQPDEPKGALAPEAAAAGAALRPFLTVETMTPRLRADSKAGVIAELLDLLHSRGLVRDRDAAARAVFEREQCLPTGLQNGVALPHARTDAVERLVCAVGLKPEGVDFEALDGRPARIVVLALAPQSATAPQLRFLALISQALREQARAALLACDTAEDMHAVLTGAGRPAARGARGEAAVSRALAWQSISLDLRARTPEEALDQLLALCARSGAVRDPDLARQDIFARAASMSVGFEHGVALPHARTAAVERVVCALGISREGLACGADDGEPARIFIMVLAPPAATTEYTSLMGALTRALDAEGRQALLAARASQEVLTLLETRGGANAPKAAAG